LKTGMWLEEKREIGDRNKIPYWGFSRSVIKRTTPSTLVKDLGLKPREVIALVGAGGKTSLMYTLAKELRSFNHKVITTTTTKIYPPESWQSPALILGGAEIWPDMRQALDRFGHVTWAGGRAPGNKLAGVLPVHLSTLWASGLPDFLIVEADGSAQRPIKAPGSGEPVVPMETTLFISIVGLSALNKPLNKDQAFRPEIISLLTGVPLGAPMTWETIARLMVHSEGGLKGWLTGMRAVILLNQSDAEPEPGLGDRLAGRIEELAKGRINKVLIR
jgi:probable selenium-dependent hydroxylase accessory protein YqeC